MPTEDTYALLLRAYCNAGQLHRAEGVISEMQENGIPPSMHLKLHSSDFSDEKYLYIIRKTHTKNCDVGATVYNAYLDGLLKARCTEKAVEVYQRMKKERCRTNTETYTLMINVYGKVGHFAVCSLMCRDAMTSSQ